MENQTWCVFISQSMKCVHSLLMLDPRLLLGKRKVQHAQVKSVQVPLFKINQLPPSILPSFLTKTGIYAVFVALSPCIVFFFSLRSAMYLCLWCRGSDQVMEITYQNVRVYWTFHLSPSQLALPKLRHIQFKFT